MARISLLRRFFQAWSEVLDSLLGPADVGDVPVWDGDLWVPGPVPAPPIPDHNTLGVLAWVSAAHTATAGNRFAGFTAGGVAQELGPIAAAGILDHFTLGNGLEWTSSGHTSLLVGIPSFAAFDPTGEAASITAADLASVLDHADLGAGIGVNTHAQIDTHIADTSSNPHDVTLAQVGGSLDHADLLANGNLEWTSSGHTSPIMGIASVGFYNSLGQTVLLQLNDFTNIQDHADLGAGIGTNSHAVIDTHIADATIHFPVGSIQHPDMAAGGLVWTASGHTGTGPFAAFSGGVAAELTAAAAAALLDHALLGFNLEWVDTGHTGDANTRAGHDTGGDPVHFDPGLTLTENNVIGNTTGALVTWTYDTGAVVNDFDLKFGPGTEVIICNFTGYLQLTATITLQTSSFAGAITIVGLMHVNSGLTPPVFTTYANMGWSGAGAQIVFTAGLQVNSGDEIYFELYAGGAGSFNIIERRAAFIRTG